MPYLVDTPNNPRSFLTNNPVIYMDARSWGWPTESRAYHDYYCECVRNEENERGEWQRRDKELEAVWAEECQRRKEAEERRHNESSTDDDVSDDGEAHERAAKASHRNPSPAYLP